MKLTVQYYEHKTLGLVAFTDNRENHHSSKARSHNIKLAQSLGSRTKTAEVKNEIIQDINNAINITTTGDRNDGKNHSTDRPEFGDV